MIYLLITAGVFLLDYCIKAYIDRHYIRKEKHPHLGGRIILEKYYNNGAMLNILQKRPRFLKLIHTIFLLAVGMVYYLSLRHSNHPVGKTGLALLLGGGASNLFDRYTKGHVVDYFRIDIGSKRLKNIIFNISDFCIFIGTLLAALDADYTTGIL